MANFVEPDNATVGVYQGVSRIFQFTNWDGELVPYNCGQAAAATYLTFREVFPPLEAQSREIMERIEEQYPPDNLGGWFGSSRRCVERICRSNGMPLEEIEGEKDLRDYLSRQRPVIVMLGVPGPKLFDRISLPAGHWMVAYGFDNDQIYLTNQGKMAWDVFRQGWSALVPRLISMTNRALTAA